MKRKYIYIITTIFLVHVIFVILLVVGIWFFKRFGVSIEAILYTVRTPLGGANTDIVYDAFRYTFPFIIIALFLSLLVFLLFIKLFKRKSNRKILSLFISLMFTSEILYTLYLWNSRLGIIDYIGKRLSQTSIYDELYVDPRTVSIKNRKGKKNLIYVYLESLELSFSQQNYNGVVYNLIPNLTDLSNQNVSFSNNGDLGGFYSISGTDYTTGAIFASTTGVPLAFPGNDNDMEKYGSFASGIYNMGDFLKDEGYKQMFLCGSNSVYSGKKQYFLQHGDFQIYDYYNIAYDGYVPEDYFVWWGVEDLYLYEAAKTEILKLSENDQPFNVTILTVDTHFYDGYVCKLCGNEFEEQYANVIACADRQIVNFIDWCRRQDFFDDTVIVITGDHPAMETKLVGDRAAIERPVYNCIMNSEFDNVCDKIKKNRAFTTMDLFPTVIAALGYEIEGERLGLGTNMYSGKATLAEIYGIDYLDQELLKYSKYYMEHFP